MTIPNFDLKIVHGYIRTTKWVLQDCPSFVYRVYSTTSQYWEMSLSQPGCPNQPMRADEVLTDLELKARVFYVILIE